MGQTRSTFTEATLAEEIPVVEDLLAAGGVVVVDQPGNRRGPRVGLHPRIAEVRGPKGMKGEELFGRLDAAQIEYWPGLGNLPLRVEQTLYRVLQPGWVYVRVPYHGSRDRLTFALTVLRAMGSEPEDGRWRRRPGSSGEGGTPSTKPPKAWWLASDGRWYPPEKKPGRPEG